MSDKAEKHLQTIAQDAGAKVVAGTKGASVDAFEGRLTDLVEPGN